MKFIHCADVHLGSKIEAKLPKEKADERKMDVRNAFSKMVDYAKNNGINVILLAGDVFDSDSPLKKDKGRFYDIVNANPDIDFLYLRGNHDVNASYTRSDLPNLKCFSSAWQTYEYGDTAVTGVEISGENASSIYTSLSLDKNKTNIVMLHGQTGSGRGEINLNKLRNKNIDYLALGHIHTFSYGTIDERGVYAYSGCLEGRGFDETGEKGFVVVDTDGKLSFTFVKNSVKVIEEREVDVTGCKNIYEATRRAADNLKPDRSGILRVVLKGDVDFDTEDLVMETKKRLADKFYFVDVRDKTVRSFKKEDVDGDISLKGEFIRMVYGSSYSEQDKREIISLGLKALDGDEV